MFVVSMGCTSPNPNGFSSRLRNNFHNSSKVCGPPVRLLVESICFNQNASYSLFVSLSNLNNIQSNGYLFIFQLEEILDGLFSAQCPDVITSSKHAFIFENFEANSEIFAGFVTKETEPFCGRYSLKNPDYIFMDSDGLSFPKYSVVCIAAGFCTLVIH